MKITNLKLTQLFRALNEISEIENPTFTGKAYYAISQNLDIITSAIKVRDKELLRIFAECGSLTPHFGMQSVPADKKEIAQAAIDTLDEIEIDLELHQVKEDEFKFSENKIRAGIVTGLMPILILSK